MKIFLKEGGVLMSTFNFNYSLQIYGVDGDHRADCFHGVSRTKMQPSMPFNNENKYTYRQRHPNALSHSQSYFIALYLVYALPMQKITTKVGLQNIYYLNTLKNNKIKKICLKSNQM